MKFLRIVLIILVIIAVLGGILTAVAPTKMEVSRSIIINAPREIVWANVTHFQNINKWSPWHAKDTAMKITIEGTDGTVGAVSKWEGTEEVGKGSQTITALVDSSRMETKIQFIEPFKPVANGFFQIDDTSDAIIVTWGFVSAMPRPFNIMGLFMDMDKAVGADFESGLNNLKTLSEEEAINARTVYHGFNVVESGLPARTFVGRRETMTYDTATISKFYQGNLPNIFKAVTIAKIELAGAPCGLFFKWDTVSHQTDVAVAVPVKSMTAPLKGWEVFNVDSGRGLTIDYHGDYNKIGEAHRAMDEYMKDRSIKTMPKIVIEEYITYPTIEKDTAKWLTKIYYYL